MDSRPALAPPRALPAAAVFGLMHAIVDACSVAILFWGLKSVPAAAEGATLPEDDRWLRFALYTVLAFGTQFALGAIADRWRAYRATVLTGLALIAGGAAIFTLHPLAALIVAALGNAAFHVGGGGLVLSRAPQRAAAAGIFVGPGAIGLAAGMWFGRALDPAPLLLLIPLAVCAALATPWPDVGEPAHTVSQRPLTLSRWLATVCAAAIIVAIAIRSANGQDVPAVYAGAKGVLWGLAVASCLGGMLGGLLADRIGWLPTCVLALVVSTPLLGAFVQYAPAAIIGMLLVQMTMPVTLVAMLRLTPGEPGLAFGLTALAVLFGVVPAYVLPAAWSMPPAVLVPLNLAALAALLVGLPPLVRGSAWPVDESHGSPSLSVRPPDAGNHRRPSVVQQSDGHGGRQVE